MSQIKNIEANWNKVKEILAKEGYTYSFLQKSWYCDTYVEHRIEDVMLDKFDLKNFKEDKFLEFVREIKSRKVYL